MALAHADSSVPEVVRFQRCTGWGFCWFIPAQADSAPSAAPIGVRLRGVGDPALSGMCDPERDAAHTIRTFIERMLSRAGRITLEHAVARPDGAWLATVRVDGTDVVDILIHIGLGREASLPPNATWCD